MVARVSAEMLRAIELIKSGKTRSAAAREVGIRVTSITRSRLFQELPEELKTPANNKRGKR